MATKKTTQQSFDTLYTQLDSFVKQVQTSAQAAVQANTTLTKGTEDIARQWLAFSQDCLEKTTAASKDLLTAKTVNEAVEKQSQFAQASFNELVAEATKLSEQAVKVSTEAFEPLKKCMEETAETVTKTATAA